MPRRLPEKDKKRTKKAQKIRKPKQVPVEQTIHTIISSERESGVGSRH
jgi:hypothetical protein